MQIREVVDAWCGLNNAEVLAHRRHNAIRAAFIAVAVLVVAWLVCCGGDHVIFTAGPGNDGVRSNFKFTVALLGVMASVLIFIVLRDAAGSLLSWDHLSPNWEVDDELLGLLAVAPTVPESSKSKIAARLTGGEAVTVRFLAELDTELARAARLAGDGHQSILRFAPSAGAA